MSPASGQTGDSALVVPRPPNQDKGGCCIHPPMSLNLDTGGCKYGRR